MSFFNPIRNKKRSSSVPSTHHSPPHPTAHPATHPPTSPVPRPPKTVAELEQQMAIEAKAQSSAQSLQHPDRDQLSPMQQLQRWSKRGFSIALWCGIPVGLIALINLPYAPIRRPIAEKAPLLLLPSYIGIDHHFRQAFTNLEAAKQLIDTATAPEDLQLGATKLQQAQTNLDRLPTWAWSELPHTQGWWWYGRSLSPYRLNQARAEIGRLQSKLLQENNAQMKLAQAEQMLGNAAQQHQEAQTPIDQQAALRVWQDGLDQLQQIPSQTLASRMAQQRLVTAQRDFSGLAGATLQNQQSAALINAARHFGWQAAQASQNGPHPAAKWQQALDLWQQAIQKLDQVSLKTDPIGYQAAQKLKAEYQKNYSEIQMRQRLEEKAVQDFQQAQQAIEQLIFRSRTPHGNQMGQLQQIIQRLEAIDSGTTVYPESQRLLLSAKQKLQEWQR
ncbi:MAG: hypothetical protein MUF72_05415 [Elainella sp. Prado103]|nr:hypothetical protein [Elainella sp. Prado103]